MSKNMQSYTNRKQNRFQPERMRGNILVNNSGKHWMPGESSRAERIEELKRKAKKGEKKGIAGGKPEMIVGNMAGYKDSGIEWIGEIPKEWEALRLKYVSNIYAAKASLFGEWPVEKNGKPYTPKEWASGDEIIITGRVGTIGQYEMLSKNSKKKVVVNDNRLLIEPYRDKVLSHFLFWAVAIINLNDIILGSAVPLITATKLLNKKVVIPPLSEQQRIADFLDSKCGVLDHAMEAISQQIENLEKYKKALITKAVTKGIGKNTEERNWKDSGVEWIGDVPEEWDVSKVKYNFSTFKKIPGKESENYDRLSLTMYGVKRREKWTTEGLQPKDFSSYQLLRKNDLVFRLIDLQNPSKSRRIALSHDTGLVSPAYTILHADEDKMLPEYAEMFFLMMSYLDVFNALGSCGVRSSINNAELLKIPVLVPPLSEQQQIADFLDEKCKNIDNRIQKRKEQLEGLKEYKKSMIYDYVTGKKRV